MSDIDVTALVETGEIDDELLSLTKCVCGRKFEYWKFPLSIYREPNLRQCPECGRSFYFSCAIRVFEIVDDSRVVGDPPGV